MEPLQQVQKDIEAVQDEISKVNSLLEQATERADIHYYREKEKQLRTEKEQLRTEKEQLRAKELLLLQPAGVGSGALADLLAQPLPTAVAATYERNQEEKDRFNHPSRVQDWPSLAEQARARFRASDVQVLAGKAYGLDNLADLNGQAFITSEAESNRLLGRAIDRVNTVLNQQPGKWNIVLTSQASIQPTASTEEEDVRLALQGFEQQQSAAPVTSSKGDGRKQKDSIPDFCGIRRQKIRRYVLFILEGKSPYRMKGVARYGLVLLWNEVVELLSQGTSMTSALQSVAVKTGLSKTAIKNAIHCLGQCYKYMSERGHAFGSLSDYNSTWILYADKRGDLLVSDAISCEQRSEPDCLSVTEALFFAVLGAHDEDSTGQRQPYPAAEQPGQPPRIVPPMMPKDDDMLGLQDSAVVRGAFCVPAIATATATATAAACAGSPVADLSLADLQLGPSIARQTYHAMLDGKRVVVRMGFTPKQRRHVNAEATALRALHALHGADVPRLLAHGYTREGFAYVVTEYIDGRTWDGSSAADRSLGDQLRAGLMRIHQHGVIQNDVKPDNILVEHATGRPVFVDFALARHSLDPEEHDSEDSELHAMLRQADPGWLPSVQAARASWAARQAQTANNNSNTAWVPDAPVRSRATALQGITPADVHTSTHGHPLARMRPMPTKLHRNTLVAQPLLLHPAGRVARPL